MSDKKQPQNEVAEEEEEEEQSEEEEESQDQQVQKSTPQANQSAQQSNQSQPQQNGEQNGQQHLIEGQELQQMLPPRAEGYRPAPIRESRIKDRPYKEVESSMKIKIELDLEVEVRVLDHVKGYILIGKDGVTDLRVG
jgi:outer membrane biosynthesis protein TonB